MKAKIVKTPEWLQSALYGAGCGAVAIAAIGFTWGGWVTGSSARQMAQDQSKTDMVAALSLICIDQTTHDPLLADKLAELKAASAYSRGDLVVKAGWATMPGMTEANAQVAKACATQLAG